MAMIGHGQQWHLTCWDPNRNPQDGCVPVTKCKPAAYQSSTVSLSFSSGANGPGGSSVGGSTGSSSLPQSGIFGRGSSSGSLSGSGPGSGMGVGGGTVVGGSDGAGISGLCLTGILNMTFHSRQVHVQRKGPVTGCMHVPACQRAFLPVMFRTTGWHGVDLIFSSKRLEGRNKLNCCCSGFSRCPTYRGAHPSRRPGYCH